MAYLGKEYKYESQENFEEFLKAIGLPQEQIAKIRDFKPSSKLEKDGDTYIFTNTTTEGTKVVKFQSGVQFDDKVQEVIPIKTTYTVDGNTVTQLVEADKGTATFKREYNGDSMKITFTSSIWDGVAYRYYKA